MKKLLPIVLTLLVLLTACGQASDGFNKYIEKSDAYSNKLLPSGAIMESCNLERDKDKYYTVLKFAPYFDDTNQYTWAYLKPAEQKADMKYAANMVMDYGVSENWDNDYYLYITVETASVSFVYDYENDTLYYPDRMGAYRLMYKDFNTMDPQELIGSEDGETFLIKYGFAEIKHKKVELYTSAASPLSINIEKGEFSSEGLASAKTE